MNLRYKIGIVVLLAVLGVTGIYIPSWWQKYQIDKAISELKRPYREDVFGGKTPEETFDMFLSALKNGDLPGASKFLVLGKQEEYLEKFEKMKSAGALEKQIEEWERARKEWTKVVDTYNNWKTHATVKYPYERKQTEIVKVPRGGGKFDEVVVPAGIYFSEITFYLNEASNVWKITLL